MKPIAILLHQARRRRYMLRFGIKRGSQPYKLLTWQYLNRLDRCKDDDARKVLLGIKD